MRSSHVIATKDLEYQYKVKELKLFVKLVLFKKRTNLFDFIATKDLEYQYKVKELKLFVKLVLFKKRTNLFDFIATKDLEYQYKIKQLKFLVELFSKSSAGSGAAAPASPVAQ